MTFWRGLQKSGLCASRSEARRNVEQGGVSVDGTPVKDIKAAFAKDRFAGDGMVFKRGKKNFHEGFSNPAESDD